MPLASGSVPLATPSFSPRSISRTSPARAENTEGRRWWSTVPDVPALHRLLRRAFQLSKALPNELLHTFEKQVASLPKTTEAERLIVQRVGQNLFRDGLLDLWEGRCAVTELSVHALLRASHIKPWADCETDAERLDVYNGILLAPHLDAAFDRGFSSRGISRLRTDPEILQTPSAIAIEGCSNARHAGRPRSAPRRTSGAPAKVRRA